MTAYQQESIRRIRANLTDDMTLTVIPQKNGSLHVQAVDVDRGHYFYYFTVGKRGAVRCTVFRSGDFYFGSEDRRNLARMVSSDDTKNGFVRCLTFGNGDFFVGREGYLSLASVIS
jgi:hypothetical protein